jgi:hypothetical protein
MSLAIDVDKVSNVLLADGWHTVKFGADGKSTFKFDDYVYIRNRGGKESAPEIVLERGECQGVPPIGATWLEEQFSAEAEVVYCPITAILAVKIKGQTQQ